MTDKIKILFLAPHLSTGGMPQFLLKRIQSLVKYELFELFVVEYTNFSDHFVVQKNQIKSLIKPENFITLGEDKHQVIDFIKQNNIDIVHVDEILEGFGQDIPSDLFNDLYSNERTWKVVETCHNIWFDPNAYKKFNPDAYAFCTPYHKQATFSKMPSYGEVIQYPLENKVPSRSKKEEAMSILGFDMNKIHVINVGLWTPGKNQKEGVELAKLLVDSNPEIQFHFIGNQAGNFEEYWAPIMQNIPSNVTVWYERSDIDTFMTAADVFMFNSTWECNPLVLKEAASHGLKILSRNLPQYLDMFTKYITPISDNLSQTKELLLNLIKSDSSYIVEDELLSYEQKNISFYTKVHENPVNQNINFIPKPIIAQNYICNPFLEIKGNSANKFKVEFSDENGRVHYSNTISSNHWIKLNREYYTKWTTKVWENGTLIHENTLDLKDKKVYIALESSSLGDTLAWTPYIREFKDKHQCELIVSTFMNNLFIETYPDIKFVPPGSAVNDIYAMYRIGWFYKDEKWDNSRHPTEFKCQPLQKTSTDILGLDYKETKAILKVPNVIKKRKVGIGIHSTCQAKYWNNPNGWQTVVNYLNGLGYDVVLYSRENDGYMGNYHPEGITKFEAGSVEKLIEDLATCEFFVGLGSGLTWLAWTINLPVVLISGFSEDYSETHTNTYRVLNKFSCHGCFNRYRLDSGDWNWCPDHKEDDRQFECTKNISPEMVISNIDQLIQDNKKSKFL